MTSSELKVLVGKGESQHLEFKKKADHPDKIVREMVAFANSGGGMLMVGVDDNGRLSGLKYPEEELYVLEAALGKYAKPTLPLRHEIVGIGQGLFVLVFHISNGTEKPYFWLTDKEKLEFKVFVRSKDQSLKASPEMFRILSITSRGVDPLPFQVNKNEQLMLKLASQNGFLTIPDFGRFAKIPKWKVSKMFVHWVLQGVLYIKPNEEADQYFLTPAYENQFEI